MKTLYFIVNPLAKNGYGLKTWKKAELELKNKQMTFQTFFTEYPGHAKEIAEYIGKKASGEKSVIVAVGGDGTLHEIMNGMIKYPEIAIGFIPSGSGNDFSRGFTIPRDSVAAVQLLINNANNEPILIDLGKIVNDKSEETYFVNNMGAGFDALIAIEANRSRLKAIFNRFSLGKLIYSIILIKKLFTYRCSGVVVHVDGKPYKFPATWFVAVANQPYYGGGMIIAPEACPTDGHLNITVVHNLSRAKLLAVFISVFWGGHIQFKEVVTLKGKKVTITSLEPLSIHLDGEIFGTTPVTIDTVPQALPVITGSAAFVKRSEGVESI
jgi:diacylglycerol kinase (ATP)